LAAPELGEAIDDLGVAGTGTDPDLIVLDLEAGEFRQ
jgi:hypothetical protein